MSIALQVAPYATGIVLIALALLGMAIFLQVNKIESELSQLLQEGTNVATTLAQLDAAIAAETQENATLVSTVTQLATDITALIAAVNNGQDFTNELNAVNANLATITGVVTQAATEDAAVKGATPPPPAPPA